MAGGGGDEERLLAGIRANAERLRFESPSAGALAIARLRWGLPKSEEIPLLDEAQRALAAIAKTIRHAHRHDAWLDQYGDGRWFEFHRHVTEGDQRWDFSVKVHARRDGGVVVDEANVVRPGDREEEEAGERATAPAGMVACPCCGRATISARGMYEICPVCFWEDDGQDNADAAEARGGPNRTSLVEGRRNYLAFGASCEDDRDKARPPTAEEVQLRRFDRDGREVLE